jgi:hypothetical protein
MLSAPRSALHHGKIQIKYGVAKVRLTGFSKDRAQFWVTCFRAKTDAGTKCGCAGTRNLEPCYVLALVHAQTNFNQDFVVLALSRTRLPPPHPVTHTSSVNANGPGLGQLQHGATFARARGVSTVARASFYQDEDELVCHNSEKVPVDKCRCAFGHRFAVSIAL